MGLCLYDNYVTYLPKCLLAYFNNPEIDSRPSHPVFRFFTNSKKFKHVTKLCCDHCPAHFKNKPKYLRPFLDYFNLSVRLKSW